jgi:hypothetical protein
MIAKPTEIFLFDLDFYDVRFYAKIGWFETVRHLYAILNEAEIPKKDLLTQNEYYPFAKCGHCHRKL